MISTQTSFLQPPKAVSKMTSWKPELFNKKIEVPYLIVEECMINKMKNIKHNVLNAKLHQREADVVADAGKPGAVTIATNMAGRGTDIKLGDGVKDAGGLAIIGTERHESRRVDRQLRGRAGRQGDPGSSQFYVSLEDNLMRLFGSGRIASLMDRMGLEEGEGLVPRPSSLPLWVSLFFFDEMVTVPGAGGCNFAAWSE